MFVSNKLLTVYIVRRCSNMVSSPPRKLGGDNFKLDVGPSKNGTLVGGLAHMGGLSDISYNGGTKASHLPQKGIFRPSRAQN